MGSDTVDLLSYADAVAIARQALRDWAAHEDLNPARQRVHVGRARASVHCGGTPSEGVLGVQMHGETLAFVGDQQMTLHYPPVCALYSVDGRDLVALLMGQEPGSVHGTIARLRTAAISALGSATLARDDARTLALFGSGKQARYHLQAHLEALPLAEVRVFSPTAAHRERFVAELGSVVDARLLVADSPETALEGADVVVAATNTTRPVFAGTLLQAGMHVTTIGGSNVGLVRSGLLTHKRSEVDDATLARAERLVILSRRQAEQDEQGEIVDPIRRGATSWERIVELRAVLAGQAAGREHRDQVTVFMNNAGTGIVDVAIAGRLYAEALRRGRGRQLDDPSLVGEHA
jgi:ornithine cyclodeaminase/alanine dehydrogenase-like protein (mu-crystallin family)